MQVAPGRIRIPDVSVSAWPLPEVEVFTEPPCLCFEVMSTDATFASLRERLEDYLNFGVLNIWVIDPCSRHGWHIASEGWALASSEPTNPGIMRPEDGKVAMAVTDVLLP